jgi:single-strand DNA-binding protein
MINKVTLVGNIGRDPEVRTLENGTKVGTFSIATTESYKDKNDTWQNLTEWHNIVVWRYLAEKSERELKKGSLAFIEGKITHRKYNDKDGIERTTTEIVASTVNSLERREKSGINNNAPFPTLDSAPASFNKPENAGSPLDQNPMEGAATDDLPF